MNDVDICRIIACLLDNAIEAAIDTDPKKVSVLMIPKPDKSKMIIITNSTQKPPDSAQMLTLGMTTKAGHHGIGLNNVRKIIDRYANCAFSISYFNNEMTAYVELR